MPYWEIAGFVVAVVAVLAPIMGALIKTYTKIVVLTDHVTQLETNGLKHLEETLAEKIDSLPCSEYGRRIEQLEQEKQRKQEN